MWKLCHKVLTKMYNISQYEYMKDCQHYGMHVLIIGRHFPTNTIWYHLEVRNRVENILIWIHACTPNDRAYTMGYDINKTMWLNMQNKPLKHMMHWTRHPWGCEQTISESRQCDFELHYNFGMFYSHRAILSFTYFLVFSAEKIHNLYLKLL